MPFSLIFSSKDAMLRVFVEMISVFASTSFLRTASCYVVSFNAASRSSEDWVNCAMSYSFSLRSSTESFVRLFSLSFSFDTSSSRACFIILYA